MGALDELIAEHEAKPTAKMSGSALDSLIDEHNSRQSASSRDSSYSNEDNPLYRGLVATGKAGLGALNTAARTIDRFTGAPMRAGIGAAQNADQPQNIPYDASMAAIHQFGADPDKAPTGEDIVKKAGVPEGIPSKAAGFAMDVAANPLNFIPELGAIEKFGNAVSPVVKGAVSRGSELMTGVPKEAIERLIERPAQVMNAEKEGNALNVARKARDEFQNTAATEDAAIGQARKNAVDKMGDTDVPVNPITERTGKFLEETKPMETPVGTIQGPVTPTERSVLERYQQIMQGQGDGKMKFAQLQKLADEIKTRADLGRQAISPGAKETRGQGFLNSLYGQIKSAMHEASPDLAAADARYSEYADNAGKLGKLENEDQMEGFINNYFGKNKTLMRESAEKVIPNSVEDIADIGASRAFGKQGPAGSEMGRRAVGGVAAGATLAATGHPIPGAVVALATSPGVHKAVIGNAAKAIDAIKDAKWFKLIQDNPKLLQNISDPSLRKIVEQAMGETAPAFGGHPEHEDRTPAMGDEPHISGEEARKQFLEGN